MQRGTHQEVGMSSAQILDSGCGRGYTVVMKITVSIPDVLFRTAEILIRRMRVSRGERYRRVQARCIEQQEEQAVAAALNEVYGGGSDAGRLDPVLDALQSATLPREPW